MTITFPLVQISSEYNFSIILTNFPSSLPKIVEKYLLIHFAVCFISFFMKKNISTSFVFLPSSFLFVTLVIGALCLSHKGPCEGYSRITGIPPGFKDFLWLAGFSGKALGKKKESLG